MPEKKILHQFNQPGSSGKSKWREVVLPALVILVIILSGSVTGYLLAGRGTGAPSLKGKDGQGLSLFSSPNEAGVQDEESFPDKAQGKLKENDSQEVTEGSHQLVRPGGESQTAYLTSSVVDLDEFLDECVEVWGQTFAAQKAGWLMDIGYIRKQDKCPEGI
jgi:hypothetical protein